MSHAESVLREIEAESEKQPMIIIGPQRGKILDEMVLKYKPKKVLEIGTLVGYSAIRMGRLLPKGAKMTCVEKDAVIAAVARGNIAKAGLDDVIEVKVGDAREVIPTLPGLYDMVFIDAEKVEYLSYLRLVEEKLPKGGVVIADNVKRFATEVQDYLAYVRTSGRYTSRYLESASAFDPSGDAVEVSVRL
jgi:predicted O-methyltransferase YrrM